MSLPQVVFHPRRVYTASSYMSRIGKYNGKHLDTLSFVELAERVSQIFDDSPVQREDIEAVVAARRTPSTSSTPWSAGSISSRPSPTRGETCTPSCSNRARSVTASARSSTSATRCGRASSRRPTTGLTGGTSPPTSGSNLPRDSYPHCTYTRNHFKQPLQCVV